MSWGHQLTRELHAFAGGNWASGFIGHQAAKASVALEKAGLKLQDRTSPNEQPVNVSLHFHALSIVLLCSYRLARPECLFWTSSPGHWAAKHGNKSVML